MLQTIRRHRARILTLVLFVFLLVPAVAFAQDTPPPAEPSALAEFIGLLFSSGLTVAVVQLIRRTGVVDLVPGFIRPLIAAGIGIGAVYLSNAIGITVDLSPIAALFGAGGGATLLFGLGKEAGLLKSSKGK